MSVFQRFTSIIGWGFLLSLGFGLIMVSISLLIVVVSVSSGGGFEDIKTPHAVAVVDLSGEMMSATEFRKDLKKQIDNEKIKAVVVRIDSPGGAVGAAEEIYEAIKTQREEKPIVCSMGNIAASGGVYAAMGCERVVANRGTITGSIGVIMMLPNFQSLVERFGLKMRVIKSGQFKDAGSPFREFAVEDRKILQDLVNAAYEQFVAVIAEARELEVEEVKKFADGRIILGEDAKRLNLVDELGGLDRAAKLALELSGETEASPEIVMPPDKRGLLAKLTGLYQSFDLFYGNGAGHVRLFYRAL